MCLISSGIYPWTGKKKQISLSLIFHILTLQRDHYLTHPVLTSRCSKNREHLFNETCKITKNIAYFLPRNSDPDQIGRLATNMPKSSKRLRRLTTTSSSDDADMQEDEEDEEDAEDDEPSCEIEKNVLNKVCKAWTAYFGDLAVTPEADEKEEVEGGDDYYAEGGEDVDMSATKGRGSRQEEIDYYCE